jgi:phage shock protein E
MKDIEQLIKTGNATIIDVRNPQEYNGGHVAGSINIPLIDITNKIDELKEMKNIVLCCLSGGRSARAADLLKRFGVECYDGGPWTIVNQYYN